MKYIGLLRGVNISAQNIVKIADLSAILEKIRSYINRQKLAHL